MNIQVQPMCTDEDVAVRAPGDFPSLCPKSQLVAAGTDGAFPAVAPWLLTSVGLNWLSLGLTPGMVVQIKPPTPPTLAPAIPTPLGLFAIDSISSSGLILRRPGLPLNAGMAPGPPAGVTGLNFTVATLIPQIEDCSYELEKQYGVDLKNYNRLIANLYDIREINQLCVLRTLARQYEAMSRNAGSKDDDFAVKAASFAQEMVDVRDRLILHWGVQGYGMSVSEPSTSNFGMRISR